MILETQYNDFISYLKTDDVIDFGNNISPAITNLSYYIITHSTDEIDYIKNAYEYVRDNIYHSADINGKAVTYKASDVLKAKEGICFAKSHLLAAILRCNKIPTGFCYQKVMLNDTTASYVVLHGLNAVYVENIQKWVRLDARGNKNNINAQFSLDEEKLAFPIRTQLGEEDIPIIFAEPDKNVVNILKNSLTVDELWKNLPTSLYLE
jgi:transglutaminase-like putative cysteine protease